MQSYFQKEVKKLLNFLIPDDARVFYFEREKEKAHGKFDYIVLDDKIGFLHDIQKTLEDLKGSIHGRSKVIITFNNYLWALWIYLSEIFISKAQRKQRAWLGYSDVANLLHLAGFEVVKKGEALLLPFYIPLISTIFNRFLGHLPIIRRLCFVNYVVAVIDGEERLEASEKPLASVVIPVRNEEGNIENAVLRLKNSFEYPFEIIFVEGHSKDNTFNEIKRVKDKHKDLKIKVFVQEGIGKGDAVRKGFDKAGGEVLMILDADLTVKPEELYKFYEALVFGKGEFINGSRLVYPLEKGSMRFLNFLGNQFFGLMFSWLLSQRVKDTLCGTKVLSKQDYEKIKNGRAFFGDFDPFGDFDLLFGAAKLNLKIIDLPIRYQERTYGQTNIQRFKHGWLLLKMCFFAMRKIKFI
jgi:hypothetical protein